MSMKDSALGSRYHGSLSCHTFCDTGRVSPFRHLDNEDSINFLNRITCLSIDFSVAYFGGLKETLLHVLHRPPKQQQELSLDIFLCN